MGFPILIKRKIFGRNKLTPELTIAIESDNFNCCGVKLINKGKGMAVIKRIDFWEVSNSNEHNIKKSLDQIFPINKNYWISNSIYNEDRDYYLAGGDSFYFGKLMKDKVVRNGNNYIKVKDIFEEKIKDINIKVEYDDVFEKRQRPVVFNH